MKAHCRRIKVLLPATASLLVILCGISCYMLDWSDSASEALGDDDDATDAAGTWTDSATGLMWQEPPPAADFRASWADAKSYCDSLALAGFDDWRLPSISELRTLIRDCAATETGGSCAVMDSCLVYESCFSESCNGCSSGLTHDDLEAGEGHGVCYWPDNLTGYCDQYWSSSAASFLGEQWSAAWLVEFFPGLIGDDGFGYGAGLDAFGTDDSYSVRCVRTVESTSAPTWNNFARAFFQGFCTRCHSSTGEVYELPLETYVQVFANLTTIESTTVESSQMPPDSPLPSDEERATLGQWIDDGAPED